jgi:hypothetical protein
MLKIILHIFLLNVFLIHIALGQKPVDKYDSKVVESWYELQLAMIPKTAGYVPPVVARALGYTGLTLYEALVPGMKNYTSLEGNVQGLKNLPKIKEGDQLYWPAVANAAFSSFMVKKTKIIKPKLKNYFNTMTEPWFAKLIQIP